MISSNGNRTSNRHFQMQCNRNRLHWKCNPNQRLLSRLHRLYHARDMVWHVRQIITIELINLPIDRMLSYLYT